MKLADIVKRNTAAALAKANQDQAAVEAQIAALQTERLAKLLDAEAAEIAALDERILERHRLAAVLGNRVVLLQQNLVEEQAAQHEQDYKAAVEKVVAPLARRAKAAAAIEQSLANLARQRERIYGFDCRSA